MIKKLYYTSFLLLAGCGTGLFQNPGQHIAKAPLELGMIGQSQWEISRNGYLPNSVPVLTQNIRVQVAKKSFTKGSFAQYSKSIKAQAKPGNVSYSDSLEQKPSYIQLRIMDKVGMLSVLNNDANSNVHSYLQNSKNNTLVSEVSAVFSVQATLELLSADQVFLIQQKDKKYDLQLVNKGQKPTLVSLNKAILFSYGLSRFCWVENDNKQLEIVDIVEEGQACTNGSEQDPNKLVKKKEERYDRF